MTDREKLIELLDMNCGYVTEMKADELADYLISKGVTIPVRCSECKFLDVINIQPVYAKCNKTGHIFELWKEDTREHFCSHGERRECAESFSNISSDH